MQTVASANYQMSVIMCAQSMIEQGGFTAKEFAEKCGFKLTRHLRSNLRKMVSDGILQATEAYTDRGNLATFYHKPVNDLQMPLQHPF